MNDNLNPQARQMADESMVRNLKAQVECIWPQEKALFERYDLGPDSRILDAGCGTGEVITRLASLYTGASILGVDIIDAHLDLARQNNVAHGDRIRFEHRSIHALGLPDASFDLVTCRHVLQAIPHADRVITELVRVTRPGGRIHLLVEDYGMIRFQSRELDSDEFWNEGPIAFGHSTGTDLRIGRRSYSILHGLGLTDVTVDYIVVDGLRAPREAFAAIWTAWRDGYSDAIGEHTRFSAPEARAHFNDMIATILDENAYGVWLIPVVSGRTRVHAN